MTMLFSSMPSPASAPAAPTGQTAAQQAASDQQIATQQQQKEQASGYASTLLTSGMGASMSTQNVQQKTLLGG